MFSQKSFTENGIIINIIVVNWQINNEHNYMYNESCELAHFISTLISLLLFSFVIIWLPKHVF